MKPQIKIDIISDVVCPWCYIGKRRLEKAMAALQEQYDFELVYHPFELNPEMPEKGVNQKEHLTKKFGGVDQYNQITTHVKHVAATEGLDFNFENQHVSPNTRKAHSLIQLALGEGVQGALTEAFFKAYFTDGMDLSKDENLISIATEAGLDKTKVEAFLGNEEALLQIALHEKEMYNLGISGVPFYIINNKYGISGAQPTQTFIQAFQEFSHEQALTGNTCEVDGKEC